MIKPNVDVDEVGVDDASDDPDVVHHRKEHVLGDVVAQNDRMEDETKRKI